MIEDSADKLLSLVRTQTEAQNVVVDLDEFMASSYSTKQFSLQDYFLRLPKDLRDELLQVFAGSDTSTTKDSLRDLALKLQDKIRGCKKLKVTLAFQPDDQTISIFSSWAKKNIGTNILLDIEVNKQVVGGAIIITEGQYRDYSVHKKLAQVFQIQKDEILGLLNPA